MLRNARLEERWRAASLFLFRTCVWVLFTLGYQGNGPNRGAEDVARMVHDESETWRERNR